MLPAERRRFLAGVGRRLTAQALQRREPERRYPILLTLLAQSAVDVLDEMLLLFDQAVSGAGVGGEAEADRGPRRTGQGRGEPAGAARRDPVHRARPGRRRRAGRRRDPGADRHGPDAGGVGGSRERLPARSRAPGDAGRSMTYLRQFAPGCSPRCVRRRARHRQLLRGGGDAGRAVRHRRPQGARPARRPGSCRRSGPATSPPRPRPGDVTAYRHYWELCVLLGAARRAALRRCVRARLAPLRRPGRRSCSPRRRGRRSGLEFCHAGRQTGRGRRRARRRPTTSCTPPWPTWRRRSRKGGAGEVRLDRRRRADHPAADRGGRPGRGRRAARRAERRCCRGCRSRRCWSRSTPGPGSPTTWCTPAGRSTRPAGAETQPDRT